VNFQYFGVLRLINCTLYGIMYKVFCILIGGKNEEEKD